MTFFPSSQMSSSMCSQKNENNGDCCCCCWAFSFFFFFSFELLFSAPSAVAVMMELTFIKMPKPCCTCVHHLPPPCKYRRPVNSRPVVYRQRSTVVQCRRPFHLFLGLSVIIHQWECSSLLSMPFRLLHVMMMMMMSHRMNGTLAHNTPKLLDVWETK